MTMSGIDISPWQQDLNLLNVNYDFVLIKATEGTGYVSPTCDIHYQQARKAGKKRATYHFTNFGNPTSEADYFIANTTGYVRDSVPVLDWEGAGVADVQGALTWLRRVRDHYGYKPSIYMSEWVENNYDWSPVVAEDFGLIVAKYSDYEIDNNYDMSNAGKPPVLKHWPFYWMWQWTSKGHLNGYAGDLDCDVAYVDAAQWDKYAGVVPVTTTTTVAPQPTTTAAPTTTSTTTSAVPPLSTTTTTTAPVGATTTVAPPPSKPAVQKGFWGIVVDIFIGVLKGLIGRKS